MVNDEKYPMFANSKRMNSKDLDLHLTKWAKKTNENNERETRKEMVNHRMMNVVDWQIVLID